MHNLLHVHWHLNATSSKPPGQSTRSNRTPIAGRVHSSSAHCDSPRQNTIAKMLLVALSVGSKGLLLPKLNAHRALRGPRRQRVPRYCTECPRVRLGWSFSPLVESRRDGSVAARGIAAILPVVTTVLTIQYLASRSVCSTYSRRNWYVLFRAAVPSKRF